MGLFLQVLGAVFLLILLYVTFRVLMFVGKAALIIYGVKKFIAQAGAAAVPERIKLVGVSGARWDDEQAAELAAPLPGLGFQEAGWYDLDVMGGTRLQAWVRPDQGLYAVVYQSPQAGVWSDVVSKYEDGTSLTYSNTPHGGRLRQRPGRENVYFPGAGTDELYRRMMADRPDRPTRRLSPADFPGDFERAYEEETAWRNSPEGFDPVALSPAAALAGVMSGRFSQDQVRQVREAMARNMYEVVARDLGRVHREASGVSEAEWAALAPRRVFVWDTMNVDSLRAVLPDWDGLPEFDRLDNFLGDDDDGEDDDGEGHVRRSFAALNAGVPEGQRLVKVGEVETLFGGTEPIRADVYERPGTGPGGDGSP